MTWNDSELKLSPRPIYQKEVTSTSDLAKEAGLSGLLPFTCYVADVQTEGRGRRGNQWKTLGEKSLAFSFVVYEGSYVLPHVISLSLVKVLQEYLGITAQIKWPNDILIEGKKCAGILVEYYKTEKPFYVVGIGLNIFAPEKHVQQELEAVNGGYLEMVGKVKIKREELLCALLKQLAEDIKILHAVGFVAFKESYYKYSSTLGKEIVARTMHAEKKGIARELTDRGSLILETEHGLEEILAAETIMEKHL